MVAVDASAPCRGVAVAPHVAGRVDAALRCLCLDRVRRVRPAHLGYALPAPTGRLAPGSGARAGPAALRLAGIPWWCTGKSTSHSTVPMCWW